MKLVQILLLIKDSSAGSKMMEMMMAVMGPELYSPDLTAEPIARVPSKA